MKTQLSTNDAPQAIGPYSQGICANNLVFVSGQIPIDPKTQTMKEDIKDQATQSLKNIENILKSYNLTMDNVVKTTVFLTDLNDFATVNEVYKRFFNAPFPARSCVEISCIPKGAKVEIECIAVKD